MRLETFIRKSLGMKTHTVVQVEEGASRQRERGPVPLLADLLRPSYPYILDIVSLRFPSN